MPIGWKGPVLVGQKTIPRRPVRTRVVPTRAGDALYSVEAAALLGIAPKTLANWRSRNFGPAYIKLPKGVRYLKSDLVQWLEDGKVTPDADTRKKEREAGMAVLGRRTPVQPGHRLGRHRTQQDRRSANGSGETASSPGRSSRRASNPSRAVQ